MQVKNDKQNEAAFLYPKVRGKTVALMTTFAAMAAIASFCAFYFGVMNPSYGVGLKVVIGYLGGTYAIGALIVSIMVVCHLRHPPNYKEAIIQPWIAGAFALVAPLSIPGFFATR